MSLHLREALRKIREVEKKRLANKLRRERLRYAQMTQNLMATARNELYERLALGRWLRSRKRERDEG